MKKADTTKLKKKELKSTLVLTIEKTLKIDPQSKGIKKLKKAINDAAKKISSKYFKSVKKKKDFKKVPTLNTSNTDDTIQKIE